MYTADTLSQAPVSAAKSSDLQEEAELLLAIMVRTSHSFSVARLSMAKEWN